MVMRQVLATKTFLRKSEFPPEFCFADLQELHLMEMDEADKVQLLPNGTLTMRLPWGVLKFIFNSLAGLFVSAIIKMLRMMKRTGNQPPKKRICVKIGYHQEFRWILVMFPIRIAVSAINSSFLDIE